ncbi:MAG: hypothetical protein K0R57_2423 [Paenibacillaceae bacterium]|nr:hypothetical protein [Paenibacillaceae bacterium]
MLEQLMKGSLLTNSEKSLAAYITEHSHAVMRMNIRELAGASFTSTATITRFCKKTGAESFADFKMKLWADLQERGSQDPVPSVDIPYSENDSIEQIARKIEQISVETIHNTRKAMNFPILEYIAEAISQAPVIHCFGEGDSLLSLYDFKSKMMRINKRIEFETDFAAQAHQAMNADPAHCAVIISHSGRKRNPIAIAKLLKLNQVPFTVITSEPLSVLAEMATWQIFTGVAEKERLLDKLTTYSSQVAVHYILDCLFSFVYALNYRENRNYTQYNEKMIEDICRTFYDASH